MLYAGLVLSKLVAANCVHFHILQYVVTDNVLPLSALNQLIKLSQSKIWPYFQQSLNVAVYFRLM